MSLQNPAPRRPSSRLPRRHKTVASEVIPVPDGEGEEEAGAAPNLQSANLAIERVVLQAGEEEVGAAGGGGDDEEAVSDFVVDGAVRRRDRRSDSAEGEARARSRRTGGETVEGR